MQALDSAAVAALIKSQDFSSATATVVGYGFVGKEYVKALRSLGVGRIHVCSRSPRSLEPLAGMPNVEVCAGGFAQLKNKPAENEIAVLGTLTEALIPAAEHVVELGYRRLLIEKPVSLHAKHIWQLAEKLERRGVDAWVAYNRTAYPSALEIRARAEAEGGFTSCAYTFTEMIKSDWPEKLIKEELWRWGIANSLHVMSLAHSLIGSPARFSHFSTGRGGLKWHSTGTVFVGAGVSQTGVPFSYQADWGSAGRWSIELHTAKSSYRMCPLEEVLHKSAPLAEWTKIPVTAFDATLKCGFAEELAAVLSPAVRAAIPLPTLIQAAQLTKFGEDVFDYEP